MAPVTGAKVAYVVAYVPDVDEAVKFYRDVFGFEVRRTDQSGRWAELETGDTTLAFTPLKQHEASLVGGVKAPSTEEPRRNLEIGINVSDINEIFTRALSAGAKADAEPEAKEWGQTVGYLRDPFGITIRLGSHIASV